MTFYFTLFVVMFVLVLADMLLLCCYDESSERLPFSGIELATVMSQAKQLVLDLLVVPLPPQVSVAWQTDWAWFD